MQKGNFILLNLSFSPSLHLSNIINRFAYVEFYDKASVENALRLDDSTFLKRQIKVLPKRHNVPVRPGGRGSGRGGRGRGGRGRGGGFIRGRGRGRGALRGRGRGQNFYYT